MPGERHNWHQVQRMQRPSPASFSPFPAIRGKRLRMAMALSPNHPGYYLAHLGNAYRLAGRVEEAITAFKAYHDRNPGFGLADMVIANQQINKPEEAKAVGRQLLSIRRDFTIDAWADTQFFRTNRAQLESDIAALRAAGLPAN